MPDNVVAMRVRRPHDLTKQDIALMLKRGLLPALDRFLEAAGEAEKQRIQDNLEQGAAAAFNQAGAAFGKAAEGGLTSPAALEGAAEEAIAAGRAALATAVKEAVTQAVLQGIADQASELGISFDLQNPRAVAWAEAHAAEMVTAIDDETRRQIHDIVSKGAAEGSSYDQIAKQITERFAQFAVGKPQEHIDSRAHLVAVTELGNAYEQGTWLAVQGMKDAGLAMEKYWQTVGDGKVSEGCAENEGAGWIDVDELFPSGDEHPLRFPGCRCTCLYRRKGAGG